MAWQISGCGWWSARGADRQGVRYVPFPLSRADPAVALNLPPSPRNPIGMKNLTRSLLLLAFLAPAQAACGGPQAIVPQGFSAMQPVWVDAPRPTPEASEWTVGSLSSAAPVAAEVSLDHFDAAGKHASALGVGMGGLVVVGERQPSGEPSTPNPKFDPGSTASGPACTPVATARPGFCLRGDAAAFLGRIRLAPDRAGTFGRSGQKRRRTPPWRVLIAFARFGLSFAQFDAQQADRHRSVRAQRKAAVAPCVCQRWRGCRLARGGSTTARSRAILGGCANLDRRR